MNTPIEESVNRIKQTVNWFPGLLLGLERQCGKSRAILELVHEKHAGNAFIFSPRPELAAWMKVCYRNLFPHSNQACQAFLLNHVGKSDWPIYIDEWWLLAKNTQKALVKTGRVVCRLGTEW